MGNYRTIKRAKTALDLPIRDDSDASEHVRVIRQLIQEHQQLAQEVVVCHNLVHSFTVNPGNGVASVAVTIPAPMPDTTYSIAAMPDYGTTCYYSSKSKTGFTLNFGTVTPSANQVILITIVG